MRSRSLFALIAATMFAACNSAPSTDWVICAHCTLTPRLSATIGGYAGSSGPNMAPGSSGFARVAADSIGRYFVAPTYDEGTISVFDRRGELVHVLGRQGDGPGEFRNATRPIVGPGDSLFVWDNYNRRLSLFTPQLQYVSSATIPVVTEELAVGASIVAAAGWRASSRAPDSILIFDRSTGAIAGKVGGSGRGSGRFSQIALRHDTIYAATRGPEFRVHVFSGTSKVADASYIPDWLPHGDARDHVNLQDMTVDERGRVWMLMWYPDPDFEQQDPFERGAESPVYSVRDASRRVIKIVEVLDVAAHKVVARALLPNDGRMFKEFIPGPRLYALSEANNLAPQFEIWDLELSQADTGAVRE